MQALGTVSPTALSSSRVELHWLAQVLGAVGDAFVERAPDDRQSNATWDHSREALLGRTVGDGTQLGLAFATAELLIVKDGIVGARTSARGKTLPELLRWASDAMSAASGATPKHAPTNRDYDMPEHPVSAGEPFSFADEAALVELAGWFANATTWLNQARKLDSRAGEVRCWPHHFDIGGIVMLEPDKPFEEARQMGFGLSPGDGSYDQPYFYVTPFPAPEPLPALERGHWHREGFTGAILTGTDVVGNADQGSAVDRFLRTTFARTLALISP